MHASKAASKHLGPTSCLKLRGLWVGGNNLARPRCQRPKDSAMLAVSGKARTPPGKSNRGRWLFSSDTQRAQGMKKFNISLPVWSFQATNLRLKFSIEIENSKRATQQGPFLWGGGPGLKFQSRLKISIEIETFNPGLTFSTVWIENFTRSLEIGFFQSLGPLGILWFCDRVGQLRDRKAPKSRG